MDGAVGDWLLFASARSTGHMLRTAKAIRQEFKRREVTVPTLNGNAKFVQPFQHGLLLILASSVRFGSSFHVCNHTSEIGFRMVRSLTLAKLLYNSET